MTPVKISDGGTGLNSLIADRLVEANSTATVGSPNILTATESRTLITNEGAAAKTAHTLPTAAAGAEFSFVCDHANGIRVTANTGDTIRIYSNVTASAGYVESTVVGSVIRLVAVNSTEWIATAVGGTWTDGTFVWSNIYPMGEVSYFNMTGTAVTISGTSDGSTNMVVAAPATTLSSDSMGFDNGGSNNGRLRYTGTGTKMFHVACTLSGTPSTTPGDVYVIGVAKNGSVVAASKVLGSSQGTQFSSLHDFVALATNDYLEVYIGNTSGARNFTLKSLNIFALGMT